MRGSAAFAESPRDRLFRPDAVYREFIISNGGPSDWRVTDPQARAEGAKKYLPNPVLQLDVTDLDTHDALCRRLAARVGCAVVSVDYRRAPEHPYPAALDDCYEATTMLAEQADRFKIDVGRIVVCGEGSPRLIRALCRLALD